MLALLARSAPDNFVAAERKQARDGSLNHTYKPKPKRDDEKVRLTLLLLHFTLSSSQKRGVGCQIILRSFFYRNILSEYILCSLHKLQSHAILPYAAK